jgi:hypothetical protein
MEKTERKSKPPPCVCKERSHKDGAPRKIKYEGAPSLSLRFLEGQGGDFDFGCP